MNIRVKPSHDKQALELWHDDGEIDLTLADAEMLITHLMEKIKEVQKRKVPPAPKPFMWDTEMFAECSGCEGDRLGKMICAGGIGGHEFYLENMVKLRDWLNDVFEYHRQEGCLNLKAIEANQFQPDHN